MWFDVEEGEHMSVALAMRDMELRYPCTPGARAAYPLVFDPAAATFGTPPAVSRAWIDNKLHTALRRIMSPEDAERRSWHSWRVTLALAVLAMFPTSLTDFRLSTWERV